MGRKITKMGWNKRDSTQEEHLGVQEFYDWLKIKIPTIYHDWRTSPRIKKRVDYLSFVEAKGRLKDLDYIAQNAALFIDLL